jgi:hypothetical protein
MPRSKASKNATYKFLTDDEWMEMFDKAACYYLDMSAEEFMRKWDAGEFDSIIDDPEHHSKLMQLAMLRPTPD